LSYGHSGHARIRTRALRRVEAALFSLSYATLQYPIRDSNPGPPPCEGGALATELTGHGQDGGIRTPDLVDPNDARYQAAPHPAGRAGEIRTRVLCAPSAAPYLTGLQLGVAPATGVEPATSRSTGGCSPVELHRREWSRRELNPQPSRCERDALPVGATTPGRKGWDSNPRDALGACAVSSGTSSATGPSRVLARGDSNSHSRLNRAASCRLNDAPMAGVRFERRLRVMSPAWYLSTTPAVPPGGLEPPRSRVKAGCPSSQARAAFLYEA
jgi:hypothetical protein